MTRRVHRARIPFKPASSSDLGRAAPFCHHHRMIVPLLLLVLSIAAAMAALLLPGLSDLLLLAVPCGLASLILLARAIILRRKTPLLWVVIDGSNVMHWQDGTPRIATLRAVIAALQRAGITPGVMFDANAGYKLADRFMNDTALAHQLGLRPDRVMVVPRGEPADPAILTAARDLGARVVTNDRFRDWAADFPEVLTPGFLIPGGTRDGQIWLDLGTAAPLRILHNAEIRP